MASIVPPHKSQMHYVSENPVYRKPWVSENGEYRKLGFWERRLSETELPRITVVGSPVSEKSPSRQLGAQGLRRKAADAGVVVSRSSGTPAPPPCSRGRGSRCGAGGDRSALSRREQLWPEKPQTRPPPCGGTARWPLLLRRGGRCALGGLGPPSDPGEARRKNAPGAPARGPCPTRCLRRLAAEPSRLGRRRGVSPGRCCGRTGPARR